LKPTVFAGDSLKRLREFPESVRHDAGCQLDKVRRGQTPDQGTSMKNKGIDQFDSVWDALADTPEQAANLRARAELMQKIAAIVQDHGWTQIEAARRCGVTQPRMNDLLRGRVSRFSLDALVNIATAIGCRVRLELEVA
jgi:predicted XRE-type DNA-binding protein